jgi:hypothetical protein
LIRTLLIRLFSEMLPKALKLLIATSWQWLVLELPLSPESPSETQRILHARSFGLSIGFGLAYFVLFCFQLGELRFVGWWHILHC